MPVMTMQTTIDRAGLLSPVQSSALPRVPGIRMGVNLDTGEPWRHDPWEKKDSKESDMHSTVVATVGNIESGKTTQSIAEVMRLPFREVHAGGRMMHWTADSVRANDGVCEWEGPARWYKTTSVLLHEKRINPFAANLGLDYSALYSYLIDMFELVGDPFGDDEHTVIGAALSRMLLEQRDTARFKILGEMLGALHRDQVLNYLRASTGADAPNFDPFIDEEDFRRAATRVIQRMARVLNGDLGKAFGDDNTLADDLLRPACVLYYGEMAEKAIPLVQTLIWAVRDNDATKGIAGGLRFSPEIEKHDENYRMMEEAPYAKRMHWRVKTARAYRTYLEVIIHILSDYKTVGEPDSVQRNSAEKILKHIGEWRIGRQEQDELPAIKDFFSLPNKVVNRLPHLKVGEFLVISGSQDSAFVKFMPTRAELAASKTNIAADRMAGRN